MLNKSDIVIKQGSHKKSVPKFYAIRWTASVDTLSALIAKYKLALETLKQIQDTRNGDAKRDAGTYIRCCCCCCLPTPMTLASGGSPMFPHVVHQPASPSIWPAVQSLRRGLSTNPGVTMWCVCGCS